MVNAGETKTVSHRWLLIKYRSIVYQEQWRRHTRAWQGKFPGRNTSALAAALAIKSGNKIIYQDILTALADATDDLSMPCYE